MEETATDADEIITNAYENAADSASDADEVTTNADNTAAEKVYSAAHRCR